MPSKIMIKEQMYV